MLFWVPREKGQCVVDCLHGACQMDIYNEAEDTLA